MEGVTIENHDRVKAWRKDFTAWRFVQLGILGTFVSLFFALYAFYPASAPGWSINNGYDVLLYYLGIEDGFSVMDENLNPIMLAMLIMNLLVLLRILFMMLLPIFTPRSERRFGKMFYGVPVIEYLAFIIMSIGLIVKISLLDLTVGLFPILVLVFSVICLLASAISFLAMYVRKYSWLSIFHRNTVTVTSINNIENGLRDNDKRLTVEALIWLFDALFLIVSVILVFI